MTEDETVRWHHQLSEHEFEQTPGDSEGQRSLVGYSLFGNLYKSRLKLKNTLMLGKIEGRRRRG